MELQVKQQETGKITYLEAKKWQKKVLPTDLEVLNKEKRNDWRFPGQRKSRKLI